MPRAKLSTAYLGQQTVRILLGVPERQAGWLIHALCDWIENDREPAKIPPQCVGAWIAIRDESVRIHDILDEARENGKKGGRPRGKTQRKPIGNPSETERKPNVSLTVSERNQDKDTSVSVSVYPEVKPKERSDSPAPVRTRAPAREAVAGLPASDSASDSVSVFTKIFAEDPARAIAMTPDEHLVAAAMRIIGETTNARMRGRVAKFKRLCGADELRDILTAFAAEIAAGEVPANAGATFNARLTAREAILGNS